MNLLRTTLDNGLRILVQESHSAPVVSVWLWYRVGSRNEKPGMTGISHWLEHMLFKGSERWPDGAADQAVARVGGIFNGMTSYDFTTYYETVPAQKISLALDIEADRMVNVRFSEQKVESERMVIINERQGNENSPLFRLTEQLIRMAFQVHPYGYETLGSMADLQAITYEDLYHHYQTYYVPNNAILAISGDFNAGEIERICERYFAAIPHGADVPPVTVVEPPQKEERRVLVEGAGGMDYLEIAYHIPAARHRDFFPLTVLNAILCGGSSFLVGGGMLTNHTSRLYRVLVERELAVDISGAMSPTVDPGLYRLLATVWPGKSLAEVETSLLDAIVRLQEAPVSEEELAKARRQARALFIYSGESITHQAFWLGFSEIFANYGWFMQYLRRLNSVTAADVQRVAQTYLVADNRTVGWYQAQP